MNCPTCNRTPCHCRVDQERATAALMSRKSLAEALGLTDREAAWMTMGTLRAAYVADRIYGRRGE